MAPVGRGRTELLSAQRRLYSRKKWRSKDDGVPFTVAFEDIDWPLNCPALGIPLDYAHASRRGTDASPSFDRFDAGIGYVKGNVRIISVRANRIKTNAMAHELRAVADWIERAMRIPKRGEHD